MLEAVAAKSNFLNLRRGGGDYLHLRRKPSGEPRRTVLVPYWGGGVWGKEGDERLNVLGIGAYW